jgi:4'-phosphopantetheinyl transferase
VKTCLIHLHVIDARRLTVEEGMLSEIERAEFGKLIHPSDRRRRMAFRCELRRTLAEMTGGKPGELEFVFNTHGKPSLPGGPFFNLAHAGDLAVLAVCRDAPVGVDVEPRARGNEITDCLESIAHPGEAGELRKLGREELGQALVRLWVAKEAALKAMGTGLSVEPSEFSIIRENSGRARVEWGRGLEKSADEIHILGVQLNEFPGMEVAVALSGARPIVQAGKPAVEGLVTA